MTIAPKKRRQGMANQKETRVRRRVRTRDRLRTTVSILIFAPEIVRWSQARLVACLRPPAGDVYGSVIAHRCLHRVDDTLYRLLSDQQVLALGDHGLLDLGSGPEVGLPECG